MQACTEGMEGQRRSDGLREILEVGLIGLGGHLEVRDKEAQKMTIRFYNLDTD